MMNNIERYLRRFSNIAPPGTNVLKSDSFIVKRTGRIDYNKIRKALFYKRLGIGIAAIESSVFCGRITAIFILRSVCPDILCVNADRYGIVRQTNNTAHG